MEEKIYEARPYIYLGLSFYAIVVSHSSALMVFSGALLFMTGAWVVKMRSEYRYYYRQLAKLQSEQRRTTS